VQQHPRARGTEQASGDGMPPHSRGTRGTGYRTACRAPPTGPRHESAYHSRYGYQ